MVSNFNKYGVYDMPDCIESGEFFDKDKLLEGFNEMLEPCSFENAIIVEEEDDSLYIEDEEEED